MINEKEVCIFNGAKVEDAVRKYSMEACQEVNNGEKIVVDQHGNRVSLSGELTQNQAIKIRDKD